jgi:hypothetical protein
MGGTLFCFPTGYINQLKIDLVTCNEVMLALTLMITHTASHIRAAGAIAPVSF